MWEFVAIMLIVAFAVHRNQTPSAPVAFAVVWVVGMLVVKLSSSNSFVLLDRVQRMTQGMDRASNLQRVPPSETSLVSASAFPSSSVFASVLASPSSSPSTSISSSKETLQSIIRNTSLPLETRCTALGKGENQDATRLCTTTPAPFQLPNPQPRIPGSLFDLPIFVVNLPHREDKRQIVREVFGEGVVFVPALEVCDCGSQQALASLREQNHLIANNFKASVILSMIRALWFAGNNTSDFDYVFVMEDDLVLSEHHPALDQGNETAQKPPVLNPAFTPELFSLLNNATWDVVYIGHCGELNYTPRTPDRSNPDFLFSSTYNQQTKEGWVLERRAGWCGHAKLVKKTSIHKIISALQDSKHELNACCHDSLLRSASSSRVLDIWSLQPPLLLQDWQAPHADELHLIRADNTKCLEDRGNSICSSGACGTVH